MPIPIHHERKWPDTVADTQFGFVVTSDDPGTYSGTLEFYGGGTTYRVSFNNVTVHEYDMHTTTRAGAVFHDIAYESDPQYVSFKEPFAMEAAWVSAAETAGMPETSCPTMPAVTHEDGWKPTSYPQDLTTSGGITDTEVRARAPSGSLFAIYDGDVDLKQCKEFFSYAKVVRPWQPAYPSSAKEETRGDTSVLARVVLDANGKVLDAALLQSASALWLTAGSRDIDEETLRSVRLSTYSPARFLCVPVPGIYVFRANYSPG